MQSNDLKDFLDGVCSESHLRVEADLGDGFVRLRTDEAERRQAAQDIQSVEDAVIELLRNSRDAQAHNIYLAFSREGDERQLLVIDDGCGIPEGLHEAVFEPRVTSKLDSVHMDKWGIHGRGMALYSIHVNAKVSSVVVSFPGGGTSLRAAFDVRALPEKKDQSTFPSFSVQENKKVIIKGPHNILRTAVEFALEHRSSVNVFAGSPSEIAATLYESACERLGATERTFGRFSERTPVVSRLAYCQSPTDFTEVARLLGFDMSDRTSRRILDGDIVPLAPLADMVKDLLVGASDVPQGVSAAKEGSLDLRKPAKDKIHFSRADLNRIGEGAMRSYKELADSYYLSEDIEPEITIRNGSVVIKLPIIPLDNI